MDTIGFWITAKILAPEVAVTVSSSQNSPLAHKQFTMKLQ